MSDLVIVALISAVGSVCAAVIAAAALVQSRTTHHLINSRMDEMLALTRTASLAEGVARGEQAQRDRAAEPQS